MPVAECAEPRVERPRHEVQKWPVWWAFVSQAASVPADSDKGRAFIALPGSKRVVLAVGDGATHEANLREVQDRGWADRWRQAGVQTLKWWRVDNSPYDRPPAGNLMWPAVANPETPREYARMATIMDPSVALGYEVTGVFALGKAPGFPTGELRPDTAVFLECFRQSHDGDHNIANSMRWWRQSGVRNPIPVVQDPSWGLPFGTLPEQVAEARAEHALGVGFYLLENCPASLITECAHAWESGR